MTTESSRSQLVPLPKPARVTPRRGLSLDEEEMSKPETHPHESNVQSPQNEPNAQTAQGAPNAPNAQGGSNAPATGVAYRDIPIDWEALEDAFENNAPEVHSYLHLVTGDVLRVVDGVADPQMHARIAADTNYLRIDPVSSREQYRWMERFIPMVEEPDLASKLTQAIDGKGAFRRFKDVLMSFGPERERWFSFRSERLRIFMEAWLNAHALTPVARPVWVPVEAPPRPEGEAAEPAVPVVAPPREEPVREAPVRRGKSVETLRKNLRDLVDALGPRDLDTLTAFAEFLKARRAARSFAHHQEGTAGHAEPAEEEHAPDDQEIGGSEGRGVSS